MSGWSISRIVAAFIAVIIGVSTCAYMIACPFCSAINLTFTEQIKSNDIVVIAKLLHIPKPVDDPNLELPKSLFEISDVIKGGDTVRTGMKFRSLLVGKYPIGNSFLVMGVDPPNVAWSTPMKASDRVVDYLRTIQKLPETGHKRLAFFQDYFEDEESVLAFDAYDEFAQAPYESLIALKDEMNREQLVKWIKDSDTSTNRRRLYLTMLGVCGQESDIKMLEEFIKSGDRKKQAGLDALIGCYLTLKGESGLGLVVETFLEDKKVEYVDTLAAVSALRFHGTEVEFVPRKEIVKAIRTLLDRPKIADMIIPDLARWEDWSVIEKLVQMFKDADQETSWLRVPIAQYLRSCPKPEAKKYIAELQKIDPDSIKRADFFLDFDTADDDTEVDTESDDSANSIEPAKPESSADQEPDVGQKPAGLTNAKLEETYVAHRVPLIETAVTTNPVPGANSDHQSDPKIKLPNNDIPTIVSNELNNAARMTDNGLAAQSNTKPLPIATATTTNAPGRLQLMLIPLACSVCIFVLLWSVISGWFDRLIF